MIKWILPLLVSFPLLVHSQDLAEPGYIVLMNGDTLYGEVQHIKESFTSIDFLNKIRFWDEEGKRKKYHRAKLQAFGVGNNDYRKYRLRPVQNLNIFKNYYQIVPYGGEETFLRVLTEGRLSHFEYEWIDGTDDYISSFPLFKRADEMTMVRATQGVFGLKKKVLQVYFSDCPDLQGSIESGSFKMPFEVVNYYNSQCK